VLVYFGGLTWLTTIVHKFFFNKTISDKTPDSGVAEPEDIK